MSKKTKNLKGFVRHPQMEQEMLQESKEERENYIMIIWRNNDKKLARLDVRCGCRCPEAQWTPNRVKSKDISYSLSSTQDLEFFKP